LPILERVIPYLRAPELQQAADDTLEHLSEPETAQLVAKMAARLNDPVRKAELLSMLARRLTGQWKTAQRQPEIVRVIEESLRIPALRRQASALAASTQDEAYSAAIQGLAKDKTAPEDLRVAAAEALGSFRSTSSRVLDDLIESARGKPSSNA